jgi:hypothetical protein
MRQYLLTIYVAVTDISTNEVMAGLIIGFALALACSGLFLLARKWASDPLPLLCGLMFVVSAGSMAFGVGHSRYRVTKGLNTTGRSVAGSDRHSHRRPSPAPPMGLLFSRDLLLAADADGNGQLTPEEAARFIRQADTTEKGWVDISDIDRARKGRVGPPSMTDPHPDQFPSRAD